MSTAFDLRLFYKKTPYTCTKAKAPNWQDLPEYLCSPENVAFRLIQWSNQNVSLIHLLTPTVGTLESDDNADCYLPVCLLRLYSHCHRSRQTSQVLLTSKDTAWLTFKDMEDWDGD